MSVTDALAEAYANQPAGEVVIETLQLDHITFDAPIYIATGVLDDISLPLVLSGSPILHKALQISVTPPGMGPDGPTPLKVTIDNVSSFLLPFLRLAVGATDPIGVTYRCYTTTDLSQPGDVVSGLELRDVDLGPVSADGTIGFREIELQAFPLATYDQQFYPALQQG